jgi:hypothetical protein
MIEQAKQRLLNAFAAAVQLRHDLREIGGEGPRVPAIARRLAGLHILDKGLEERDAIQTGKLGGNDGCHSAGVSNRLARDDSCFSVRTQQEHNARRRRNIIPPPICGRSWA